MERFTYPRLYRLCVYLQCFVYVIRSRVSMIFFLTLRGRTHVFTWNQGSVRFGLYGLCLWQINLEANILPAFPVGDFSPLK